LQPKEKALILKPQPEKQCWTLTRKWKF